MHFEFQWCTEMFEEHNEVNPSFTHTSSVIILVDFTLIISQFNQKKKNLSDTRKYNTHSGEHVQLRYLIISLRTTKLHEESSLNTSRNDIDTTSSKTGFLMVTTHLYTNCTTFLLQLIVYSLSCAGFSI